MKSSRSRRSTSSRPTEPTEPTESTATPSAQTLFAGRDEAFALVVSGPSGVGKTSICHSVIEGDAGICDVVTTTTRPRRRGEEDGVHYHFVPDEAFSELLAGDAFMEHATVHGRSYGTTAAAFEVALASADVVLLEVDVQGARAWRDVLGDRCVTVFVLPPSLEELRRRLAGRRSEAEEALKIRLQNAREEMAHATAYDYVIVNHELAQAVSDVESVVRTERSRPSRQRRLLDALDIR